MNLDPPIPKPPPPHIIAWEVTRYCTLACKHCRATALPTRYDDELATDECRRLLDSIAAFAKPILILTGGEPMSRPDIYEIARHATDLGLRVVMAPCGPLLNDETVQRIKASGIRRISLSMDGATAPSHDAFRGVPGAYEACMAGMAAVRCGGLDFQINTTICRHNADELPELMELAISSGASLWNPFLLVPTGRGRQLTDMELDPHQYEDVLHWLADEQKRGRLPIRVTCAPHYQRILRQSGAAHPGPPAGPGTGCLGGKSFAFISHRGTIQICGFLDIPCGNVRQAEFRRIWETSDVLRRIRNVDAYHGRCGRCEFRRVCGGCRARAYAVSGDYLGEEPYCVYEPKPNRLDELDKRLLSRLQTNLPITVRPFDDVATQLGMPADALIDRLDDLRSTGILRRLGAVFDSARLGYVSTLVAAHVPAERLEEVAEIVSALPGVTHNYQRNHPYNLWFTLTSESQEAQRATLAALRARTQIQHMHSLPARRIYKLRVHFDLTGETSGDDQTAPRPEGEPIEFNDAQKKLVRFLQESLPVSCEPFSTVAQQLGWTQQQVVEQIRKWHEAGVIRRFGAVVRHRRLGFVANAMTVLDVPEEQADDAGARLARQPEVSHCYLRPRLADFPFNLFAMIHGRTQQRVESLAAQLAAQIGARAHETLFSTREFKKTSMRYFL